MEGAFQRRRRSCVPPALPQRMTAEGETSSPVHRVPEILTLGCSHLLNVGVDSDESNGSATAVPCNEREGSRPRTSRPRPRPPASRSLPWAPPSRRRARPARVPPTTTSPMGVPWPLSPRGPTFALAASLKLAGSTCGRLVATGEFWAPRPCLATGGRARVPAPAPVSLVPQRADLPLGRLLQVNGINMRPLWLPPERSSRKPQQRPATGGRAHIPAPAPPGLVRQRAGLCLGRLLEGGELNLRPPVDDNKFDGSDEAVTSDGREGLRS